MESINFTPEKFALFLVEYLHAEMRKAESFDFEGHTFLTAYAKYVVQFLMPRMLPGLSEQEKD